MFAPVLEAGWSVEELAVLPPGPRLAALLDRIDLDALAEAEMVPVLRAWSRQRAHVHARFLAAVAATAAASRAATARARPFDADPGDWAGAEVAAALAWTETKAYREIAFAETVIGRLPQVYAAFAAGEIDHGTVWTFVRELEAAQLDPEQTEAICAGLLPRAARLTPGQLRARLRRAVLRIDPQAAARRYRAAVTERAVVGYLAEDGTAVLSGRGLRPDRRPPRTPGSSGWPRRSSGPGTPGGWPGFGRTCSWRCSTAG